MQIITDLIEKRRLWYDLPNGLFYLLQFCVVGGCLLLFLSVGIDSAVAVILMFIILFLVSAVLNRRFGKWVKNYKVTGTIKISADQILAKTDSHNKVYVLKELQQVYVETNYWQNHTPLKGGTHSGIAFLKLYLFSAEPITLHFIL